MLCLRFPTDDFLAANASSSNSSQLQTPKGRTPSPETGETPPLWNMGATSVTPRTRVNSEAHYADTEVEELLTMLRESECLEEQGDILQYLVDTQGLNYDTGEYISLVYLFIVGVWCAEGKAWLNKR